VINNPSDSSDNSETEKEGGNEFEGGSGERE
jgi:hypothetical protein